LVVLLIWYLTKVLGLLVSRFKVPGGGADDSDGFSGAIGEDLGRHE